MAPPFVCPACQGPLGAAPDAYSCDPCGRRYPLLCGIPDFRLEPDRYLSIEDDRRKAAVLDAESARRDFASLVDFYFSMTPELDRRFRAHLLAESAVELPPAAPGPLLDAGCQTGALLVAAAGRFPAVVGIDVAFRWLVVARARLREAGVAATLACANAEHLPFRADTFAAVTAVDLLEHVVEPRAVLAECRRVTAAGGLCCFATNNRYSLLPEPHVNVWGVGWLPARWQASYVERVTGRAYRNIRLLSGRELEAAARAAGFAETRLAPALLAAPGRAQWPLDLYNRMRLASFGSRLLGLLGPRLELRCRK